MKLTRKEFLKTLLAIPFMTWILPKEKLKGDLSGVLLVPPEFEEKARGLIGSMPIYRGDLVSLDVNGIITPSEAGNPIFGIATDVRSDGVITVEANGHVRRGHG